MKKNLIGLVVVAWLCSLYAVAQPKIVLRMAFNAEQNRYAVFARPNFSANQFAWGPSQVSVVLPAEVADQSVSARSTNIGVWSDNSRVFAPEAVPGVDFHGFTTQGGKVDLVAGDEFLLFDFTLPQGYIEGVRLFDTQKDPSAAKPGMKGGDFSSYMADDKGKNLLNMDLSPPKLDVKDEGKLVSAILGTALEPSVRVVAYPNPSPSGVFRLFLQGFDRSERLTVQITTLTGKVMQSFSERADVLAGKALSLTNAADSFLILSVSRPDKQQTFAQKLWLRD
ncbi:hypothetical protein [Arsenicibacter rosenii]|uniref:Secretion system C-terminal sorting domain-containing protein n=1 Tax=Arsenicibacter rosenii TaxID=1750698 RepID=A0A1S2VJU9_9BACT|nr:hypothetical protein [Arsenicibacter rosenii]OIN58098.1 hypothetical protein BLX24_16355 [Arsenicibacter rosenii]